MPPTAIPQPTETTAHSQYEKLPTGEYVYTTENGQKIIIGKINGLTQKLLQRSDGLQTVVYVAEKNNEYGLEEGAYAGEFLPNIVVNNKKENTTVQGGIRLVAPVVQEMMNNINTEEAKKAGKWQIAFPLDPGNNQNSVNKLVLELMKDYPYIRVMAGITPDMKIVNPLGEKFPVHMGWAINIPAIGFCFSDLFMNGLAPKDYDYLDILVHKTTIAHIRSAGSTTLILGGEVGSNTTEPINHPNPVFGTFWLRIAVSKNGDWQGFGLHNFIHVGDQIVFLASTK